MADIVIPGNDDSMRSIEVIVREVAEAIKQGKSARVERAEGADEEKPQLKNVQTAWLKYRDANCEFVADQYKSGTMRPMIAAICLADVTDNRTRELTAQMKERDQ